MKKYEINISCRPNYLRMFKLNDDERQETEDYETLQEVFEELEEERSYDYDFESELLCACAQYYLTVNEAGKQENIAEIESLDEIPFRPTGDEYEIEGGVDDYSDSPLFHFDGVEDGHYLVACTVMKGSSWSGELELEDDVEFDATRLYYLKDDYINDELLGDDCAPVNQIYYRKGDLCNPETDAIDLDFNSDNGGYSDDYYLMNLTKKDWWQTEREDD